ncbi:MAG: maleylpyruvate isomerase N-terminal domain-containing protein [Actinomycetota bacterium]
MDGKEKRTAAEATAWEQFEAALLAVPRDRMEEPLLTDGWSVKDVLFHIARWWEDCADMLELMRSAGTYSGWDGDTDAENARVLVQGRSLSLEDVELRSARIRERMLLAWDALTAEDPRATEDFDGETTEHYQEHLGQIESLATG